MKITKKDYEVIIDIMDMVIGIPMFLMVYAMIFEGLFDWISIILTAVLMICKVFISQESLIIDKPEEES